MTIQIAVRYFSDRNGAGKLRATGGGCQRTIGYPHHLSGPAKYLAAAQELRDALEAKHGCELTLVKRGETVFTFESFRAN